MRSDTLTVRDRILAVLFDQPADAALTTSHVCDLGGTWDEPRAVNCALAYGHPQDHATEHAWQLEKRPWREVLDCDGRTHSMRYHLSVSNRGYRELSALAKAGKVVKFRDPNHRSVFWALSAAQRDEMTRHAAQLEAMWALSDQEGAS